MNVIGASILGVVILVTALGSRRWAVLGMLGGVLFLTQGQVIELFGVNLYAVRFVELAGFIRVMARRELSTISLNGIDKILALLYVYTILIFLLRSGHGLTNVIGVAVDAFFCYFTFRALIQNLEDFRRLLLDFLILLVPYTLLVLLESLTRHNCFAFMGGVANGTWIRGDRVRCFASFRQPDTLGTLGASFLPLYLGMFFASMRNRGSAVIGVFLCLAIVWATNSGGPLGAVAVGILGWLAWRFHQHLRALRWGAVAMLAAVALIMKAPIWYILARASSVTGGTGWHRAYLIDVAVRHFDKWWLLGMPIEQTSGWFPYTIGITSGADITNEYVAFGLTAGIGAVVLLILLLKRAFSSVGTAIKHVESSLSSNNGDKYILWGLGITLAVHTVNWLGITYFDQIHVIWFMQLAAISSICAGIAKACLESESECLTDFACTEIAAENQS